MDPIYSNTYLNATRLYQNQAAPQQAGSQEIRSKAQLESADAPPPAADFSKMFDDDALLKLQGNLEAIAQMAEKSLKQIDAE